MKPKKLPALFLFVCFLMLFAVSASAGRIYDLYVSPDGTDSEQAIHWHHSNAKYYLMLPAGFDAASWKIGYDGDVFSIDGQEVAQGASADVLTAGETLSLVTGKTTYKLTVAQSSPDVQTIWLETDIDYVLISRTRTATAQLLVMDEEGQTEYEGKVSRMRVHGNSSRFFNKKSYELKLEEKTDLFGLGKNRDYVLLALYRDASRLRTSIAFDLARYAGLANALNWRFANVYFNGEYYGLFLVTGKVEIASDRVNIRDLEEENKTLNDNVSSAKVSGKSGLPLAGKSRSYQLENDPEDITGGYLLEMDVGTRAKDKESVFRTKAGNTFVVRSPRYCSVAEMKYISGLVQSFENAVSASDGCDSKTGVSYTDLIDLSSFVTVYMIEEIAKEYDANRTSQYFYKPADSQSTKLFAGPLWDFDTCFGNYGPVYSAKGLWAAKATENNQKKWWYMLSQQSEFKQAVLDRWQDTFAPAMRILLGEEQDPKGILHSLDEYAAFYGDSIRADLYRWPQKDNNSDGSDTGATVDENIEYLKKWIRTRYEWLQEEWGNS